MFLKNPVNFSKVEKEIKLPNLHDISITYQGIFCEYTYFQPNIEQKSELKEHLKDFQEIHDVMLRVKKLARVSCISFVKYQESLSGLIHGIKVITPMFLINKDLDIASKENYVNPYSGLRDWLRSDVLDIESMIEAINKYLSSYKYQLT